jgi:hypothetical protein
MVCKEIGIMLLYNETNVYLIYETSCSRYESICEEYWMACSTNGKDEKRIQNFGRKTPREEAARKT